MTKDDLQQIRKLLNEQSERLGKDLDLRFDEKLELSSAKLFGQLTRYVDDKLEVEIAPLRAGIDRLQATMDGVAKRIDTDEVERAAMNSQLDRHDGWIGQLSKAANVKLVPEQ